MPCLRIGSDIRTRPRSASLIGCTISSIASLSIPPRHFFLFRDLRFRERQFAEAAIGLESNRNF